VLSVRLYPWLKSIPDKPQNAKIEVVQPKIVVDGFNVLK